MIHFFQIHPQGHSILSRNISYDEKTEWSCIHDINEEPGDITERIKDEHISSRRKRKLQCDSDDESRNALGEESGDSDDVLFSINRRQRTVRSRLSLSRLPPPPPSLIHSNTSSTSNAHNSNSSNNQQQQQQQQSQQQQSTNQRPESFIPDIWAAEVTVHERAIRQNRARNSNAVTGYNYVYAISSGVLPAAAASRNSNTESTGTRLTESSSRRGRSSFNDLATSTDGSSTSSSDSPPYVPFERVRNLTIPPKRNNYHRERKIFQNPKKLMYYIQEPNKGKGFIKEPSFSADGRIVCSPYDNGVRLLGYSDSCCEYPRHFQEINSIKQSPRTLHVIKELKAHDDIVLSTKFSPREPLLVSGCKSGKIVWYHPIL